DIIAKENGISFDNKARIKALILDVLYRCYLSGDMYVLIERLFRGVDYVSHNTSAYPDNSVSYGLVVATLVETKQVVIETHSKEEDAEPEIRCYLKTAFFDEKIVAQNIKRLQKSKRYFDFDTESAISDAEKSLNITYGDKQKDCFGFLKSSGIKIITGGPGTGKSTVINGIISEYKKRFPSADVKLMAPTGRAAQRISEITGMTAGTIHRMLNIMPFSKNMVDSAFNGDYPADLLIVDEASMIDTALMRLLVKSIKSSALVILCGDIDQLPSVGAGNVLHELIASGAIETVQLDRNFRQLNQSVIIENAIKVNKGDSQVITSPNFQIIECKDEEEIQQVVVKQFVDLYDTNKPYDTQVLSSTRKGPAGTYSLNKHIQSIINDNSTVTAHNNSKFRLKDKVMTTHNNYDIKYFNGDVGVIQSADENFVYVDFLKERLAIPKSCVQDIELAYACTVHKSQGSEYETVIIALPSQPSVMLRRNLLYTAITRAKKNIIIVTQKGCISRAAINAIDANRKSALAEKITETERGTFEKNTRK
ncbi:MAG: AAA family ATPase, partial [Oscillospiraceae bacterium]|nr:AAA family ATPase [Oscillospiraceae bacterium]